MNDALNTTELTQAEEALRRSEELFRAIVDDQSEMIVRWKPDGTRTFVNQAYCRTFKQTYEELVGTSFYPLIKEEYREPIYEKIRSLTPENPIFTIVQESHGPNGEILWQEWTDRGIFDAEGRLVELQAVGRDITERMRAEQRIRQLNRVYAVLSDINQTIVREGDLNQLFDAACRIAVERGGFQLAWIGFKEAASTKIDIVAHAGASPDILDFLRTIFDDPKRGCAFTARALQTGKHAVCNDIATDPQSQPWRERALESGYRAMASLPIQVGTELVGTFNLYAREAGFFDEQEMRLLDELALDIGFALQVNRREVERRRAETALRESEERFRQLAETIQEVFWLTDIGMNRVFYVNPAYERIWGRTCQSLYDDPHSWLESVHPEDLARVRREILVGHQIDGHYDEEYRIIRSDGAIRWIRDVGFPVFNAAGKLERIAGAARDVTSHREALDALQESRRQLEKAQEVGHIGSWVSDLEPEGKLVWSAETHRIFGMVPGEFDGRVQTFFDMVHPEDRSAVQAASQGALSGECRYAIEHRIVRRDGQMRWVYEQADVELDAKNKPLRLIGVVQDITDRKMLEDRLRQSQKMEAIGQLAGGVAHDFNNILATMLMQAEVASTVAGVPEEVRESLLEIRNSAERAANLTRQLLLFSRRQAMQQRDLDLNESVTGLARMLQRIIGEAVRLQMHLHSSPLMIRADAGMLDQVLLNLAVNARDSMPEGGCLTIETSCVNLDREQAASLGDITPGRYACLTVSDTGGGIPSEVMPHIFEPFFTTKEPGKGTGLGLATVFGIVKQHQGWLHVQSEPKRGATFRLYLPAKANTDSTGVAKSVVTRPRGGTETILLVEDDPSVKTITRTILKRNGYSVLEAVDGHSALKVWEEHGHKIALLLTDLVMPGGMGGQQLAQLLQAKQPGLKMIYMSGYSEEFARGDIDLRLGENFLQKPFLADILLETIRRALDR